MFKPHRRSRALVTEIAPTAIHVRWSSATLEPVHIQLIPPTRTETAHLIVVMAAHTAQAKRTQILRADARERIRPERVDRGVAIRILTPTVTALPIASMDVPIRRA